MTPETLKGKNAPPKFSAALKATQFALEELSGLYCKLEARTKRLERIISLREQGE